MNKTPKLRFKEFSGEWESKKLGVITTKVGSGKTPRGGNSVYADSGIIFLRSQNVLNGKLNLNDVAYISEEINSTMKSTEVYGNDILLNITGASIGRSCNVPVDFPRANVNQHVCIIRLNEGYKSDFIMNQIISSKVQKQIDSYQAGGNREGLNFEQIKSIKVGSTSIAEQEKIASFLSLIDDKISLQGDKVEALKDYKKGMMQKIFSKELRFKDDDGRDYPEWEEKKLGDIAYICTGKKDTQDKIDNGTYPFFVRSQTIERINSYSYDGEAILTAGDGVGVGKVFHYIDGKFDYHQRVYKISDFSKNTYGRYIYEYFRVNFIREVTKYTAKTSVDSVRMEMITKMKIPYPVLEEQIKIANALKNIDLRIEKEQDKLEYLNVYRKGLLQQMFV